MQWQKKVGSAVLAITAVLAGWASSSRAQIFDTPVLDFALEALPTPSAIPFPNIPLTLNVGNYDTSVIGPGDQQLNEVVVAGISGFVDTDPVSLVHRYWTIVHDSATDTRSLVQTPPSDISVTDEFEPFYLVPDSLQLVDLDGDGADDIGVLGSVLEIGGSQNAIDLSGLKLQKSGASGPVGVFGVPSQAGPNFFATSLNILGQQTDSSIPSLFGGTPSQPSLTTADFDGDGNLDLAFYDFFVGDPGIQVAVSLRNNGSFGSLPRTDTTLNLPAEYQGFDYAYNLIAVDVDGDGPPDLAITFDAEEGVEDRLLVFKGNGDGSFVPDPIASANLGTDADLAGLAAGNFDGDEFLDFAVTTLQDDDLAPVVELDVVLCATGATCNVTPVAFSGFFIPFSLAAADYDEDGLDDLALAFIACDDATGDCEQTEITSGVAVLINRGGSFVSQPDQELLLGGAEASRFTLQVIGKDIDGCGGPDLAYTGFEFVPEPSPTPVAQGILGGVNWASVAFNHNDDPIADAGTPVPASGGFQVGGEPTCAGELGEILTIQWEVVSGDASISDPNAANPIVTAETDSVLQVTCSDLCGASSSATVTVQGGNILLNGSGCS
ncbi:MAG TPA: FG-GAP-like repeat-containing protein, partial [bacterium]|nr:FG-GAP-like repeat-containing protein [bacterium]